MAPGMLSQDQEAFLDPHRLRGHDLVGGLVFKHAVLVDACLVGKGISTNNCLVLLYQDPGDAGNQPTRPVNLLCTNIRVCAHIIVAGPEGHYHFFQGSVTGPFPDPVDGALHLAGSRLYGSQRVGYSQSKIIVTVNRQDSLVHIGNPVADGGDECPEFIGYSVSHGVRDVDGLCPGLDNSLNDLAQVGHVTSRCVFSRELNVVGVTRRMTDSIHGSLPHLVVGLLEFKLYVDVRGGDEGMDPRFFSLFKRLPGPVNILLAGPAQPCHGGLLHCPCHGTDRLEVAFRGNGEPCLYDIHVHALQLPCHLNLLIQVHGGSG